MWRNHSFSQRIKTAERAGRGGGWRRQGRGGGGWKEFEKRGYTI